MWITSSIELPEPVVQAQEAGNIVFFVGAGASVDAPSNLPMFRQLAEELAKLACVEYDEKRDIDQFLGGLPETFDAHVHTSRLIGSENSLPNRTHEAIVKLATSSNQPRIVTTNFDNHLSTAAKNLGLSLEDTWCGPALPLGEEFEGIVHLHGSVLKDATRLVLTDTDFGRAYLYHGWATRFLRDMFSSYTVVFIGYSHDDPIMRYLGLGLPKETPRYAFVDERYSADEKWARLGVRPVPYPVVDGSHQALSEGLEAWNARVRLGRAGHRARMNQIARVAAQINPVDRDYVVSRLSTKEGMLHFTSATSKLADSDKLAWLQIVEDLDIFKSLFKRGSAEPLARHLAWWFANNFVATPALNVAALHTVQQCGQSFSEELFAAIASGSWQLSQIDADSWKRWSALLSTSIIGHTAPIPNEAILSFDTKPSTVDRAAFRAVCRPYLKLGKSFDYGDEESGARKPNGTIEWVDDTSALKRYFQFIVEEPNVNLNEVQVLLEDAINSAYDLLDAYNGEDGYDSISGGQYQIDPSERVEDWYSSTSVIEALILLGRRIIDLDSSIVDRWWGYRRLLYKRAALYLLKVDRHRTDNQKLDFIIDNDLFFARGMRGEVFSLIRRAFPGTTQAVRARFLAAATESSRSLGQSLDDGRYGEYRLLNLLHWSVKTVGHWREGEYAISEIRERFPELAVDDHPDKEIVVSGGVRGNNYPYEMSEFKELLEANLDDLLKDLVSRTYPQRSFDETEWGDVLRLFRAVVSDEPHYGLSIWQALEFDLGNVERSAQLRLAVIRGWSDESISFLNGELLDKVESVQCDPAAVRDISAFLLAQVRSGSARPGNDEWRRMKRLAINLWDKFKESFDSGGGWDEAGGLLLHLNSWPGDLVSFWIAEIDARWRDQLDSWDGLDDEEKAAIDGFIEGPAGTWAATLPAIGERLSFFAIADRDFTKSRLLPLLGGVGTGRMVWKSYLRFPRFDDKMLSDGLLESIIDGWDSLDDVSEDQLVKQFYDLVYAVVSFSGIDDGAKLELLNLSVCADGGIHAEGFARAVVRRCMTSGDNIEQLWSNWLKDHIVRRIHGLPRSPSDDELRAWSDLFPLLGRSMRPSSDLFLKLNRGFDAEFQMPNEFDFLRQEDVDVLESYLINRVKLTVESDPRLKMRLARLLGQLRESLGADLRLFEESLVDAELVWR